MVVPRVRAVAARSATSRRRCDRDDRIGLVIFKRSFILKEKSNEIDVIDYVSSFHFSFADVIERLTTCIYN